MMGRRTNFITIGRGRGNDYIIDGHQDEVELQAAIDHANVCNMIVKVEDGTVFKVENDVKFKGVMLGEFIITQRAQVIAVSASSIIKKSEEKNSEL